MKSFDMDEYDIEQQAESLARKAIEGHREAIYADGEYLGQAYEGCELVYDIANSDDYQSQEIFEVICRLAGDLIDEWGGPWCTEEDYDALTGADEPLD